MGYTHYWTPKETSNTQWKDFTNVCKGLNAALPTFTNTAGNCYPDDVLTIHGGMGDGEPEFSENSGCFNGNEDLGLHHETFLIKKNDLEWSVTLFCFIRLTIYMAIRQGKFARSEIIRKGGSIPHIATKKQINFKIMKDMSKENETSDKQQNGNDFIADVSNRRELLIPYNV